MTGPFYLKGKHMASRSDWVAHLMRYSLSELRRWQSLTYHQMRAAYRMMQNPDSRESGERAYRELEQMADSLTEAVMIKAGYL